MKTFPFIFVVGLFSFSWVWTVVDSPFKALWPSIVALAVVVVTKRALVGLVTGAAAGALILSDGSLWEAYLSLFRDHFAPSLGSSWKMGAVAFTLLLGGFAAVLEKGGGFERVIGWFLRKGKEPSKALQGGVMALGLACFFDGLANSMLVGRISRKLGERCGVSRVKLAYLVDSTSSAVACLAFVSTWVAYQLSMIKEGFSLIGQDVNPYPYFMQSIPFNFYCWFTLILCVVSIVRVFNPGPMGGLESKARKSMQAATQQEANEDFDSGGSLLSVVLPLLVLLVGMVVGFYWIGLNEHLEAGTFAGHFPITGEKIAQAFGTGKGPYIMALIGVIGSVVALLCFPYKKQRGNSIAAYGDGMRSMLMPLLILTGAWMLSSTLGALKAGDFVAGLMGDSVALWAIPVLVFVVGSIISFTTGTSWGTMGLLMPLAIPIVAKHPEFASLTHPDLLFSAVVGAVFSGAVFGDHCSPISDTTIVSSIACGVEPHDHVRTQLPFALLAGGVAVSVGFIPAGFGVTPWLLLIVGAGVLLGASFLRSAFK